MAPAMEASDAKREVDERARAAIERLAHAADPALMRGEFDLWLTELRRTSAAEPSAVVTVLLDLLQVLPQSLIKIAAARRFTDGFVEAAVAALVDTTLEQEGSGALPLDRTAIIERLFDLWLDDESGFLGSLQESIMALLTTREIEDAALLIARRHLRSIPIVFVRAGDRPTGTQLVDIADRRRVELFVGQVLARQGCREYAVLAARTYHRLTGDAVDYVESLARAGMITEALEIGRKTLRDPAAPRHALLRKVYHELIGRRGADEATITRRLHIFLEEPTESSFDALKDACPVTRWPRMIDVALGHLERTNTAPELTFRLYLREGRILEADGMVTNRFLDPDMLAAAAEQTLDQHPERACGWFLTAAYHLMRVETTEAAYHRAAEWLTTVRRAAHANSQAAAFDRAIEDFKLRYGRRRALLRTLSKFGL